MASKAYLHELKAAVIGTGFIGPIHVEALRRIGVPVVGILDATVEQSEMAATQLGIPRVYKDLNELLDDDEIDSVHIATPNRFHFEHASACLKAGKHTLCEKPLAMNSDESAKLVALAESAGVCAGVNYNLRYYPLCVESADRVRKGRVGALHHVSGGYVQDWLFKETDFNWRVLASEGGELRAVADIGTHWLDLIQFITGQEIVSVCADLHTVFPTRQRPIGATETFSGKQITPDNTESVAIDTEDAGNVMLRFENGARGVMTVSQVTAGRKNCLRFELAGSKQALAFNSESPNELWIGHRDEPNEVLIRDPALMSTPASNVTSYPGGHNEGFPDAFKQIFLDFYGQILLGEDAGEATFPSFADGHREIVLCEAILESHRKQAWVSLS
ncbi:Gfo/Idh/MocA family protein [Novipirellula artificiosorum]|uniref:1,5-anhydro-D-fructose reductase n=1 Tax=Novipirellula artificiosorum TaxID=2528016 RepID=A0A5C6DB96_9BACT|nr:Gfo/Idh/MocA family oxidoreductase [Novipirellula artificiosorum]TWU33027.1 1,5-anhydro-D-fructose reductase [Novipirellula artificiosorum]